MISFREAQLSDIDNIMYLETNCFNEYTQEDKSVYEDRIKYFPQGFIIMEINNNFGGAVSSEIWNYKEKIAENDFNLGHPINKQLDLNGDELYISSIGVLPQYRNKGYGKKLFYELVNHIKTIFPKVTKGILLLNETWVFAKNIYQEYGFIHICDFADFFIADDGSKQKAIVMRKYSL
jgi:ribosomal-protein-alanine N-acetyltransferase